jgi:arylsulfatase A-like enzyme
MNLVWIVIDSLRADHLGCYGYPRRTSPHLDHLARACVRFDQAISPHIPTQPAHTTLFSGRDVFEHQIVAQGGSVELDRRICLLPELLRERGYFTAAVDNIGRWFEPVFDVYDPYPRWSHDGTLPWRNGEEVTARGLALLNHVSDRSRPFFLFLHYWDPHTPYLPPAPFDRMFYEGDPRDPRHTSMEPVWRSPWFANYFSEWMEGVRDVEFVKAQYDAEIAYTDTCLAHVFNRLSELDRWDDTLLILQSDHGEELDEHGCWFDHHGLYETNVRVPLLVRFPDGRGAGAVNPEMISILDLAPTALDALGFASDAARLPGTSHFTSLQSGRLDHVPDGLYLTECTWMRKHAWRTAEWKLIQAIEPDIYGKPELELFHLPSDPQEQVNLAETRPDVLAELAAARDEHVRRRLEQTGLSHPLLAQSDALRTWQPRFIAGRRAGS